ncbi:Glycosyl hydrolases family 16 [Salegentibacter agarivorans]|uniref:Glycosyl hydrolases family 16 n=1 Tax=Salegentibacter agarivorans TaxID=345907 RepID=A0A1I2KP65_9FLAO|nr:family 16 glycosylhydrolase [Salegentibacter agarivorans]SFF68128.1 Glycosyl hydrolases family 16 [Salegentibacter agarivorans]
MKKLVIVLFIFGISPHPYAQSGPPEPPIGKRWVINPDFSDEFNGETLDSEKWHDYHPTWKGREPGLFMPSQVSVSDGYLQIKGGKMEKDTIINGKTFNIKGGAVVSKKTALFGYFECRVKAAATTMSTTFWFSGGGGKGPKGCDNYHQEWDIQECIGRSGDFAGNFFSNGMNSNGHFWYTDCDKERHDIRAPAVKFVNTELASKDFHVYGGWWRDAKTASLYYDDRAPKHMKFYDGILEKPFNKPMYMRLVSETYPYPWIELPTDEELADDTKNTVYYDWVRSYDLVDVEDKSIDQSYETGLNLYNESVIFSDLEIELETSDVLKIPLRYKANQHRKIHIKISETTDRLKEKWDKKVIEKIIDVYPGYGNIGVIFNLEQKLSKSASYIVEALIKDVNDDNQTRKALDTSTMFFTIH